MQIIDMQVIYGTVDGFLQYVILVKLTKQKIYKEYLQVEHHWAVW